MRASILYLSAAMTGAFVASCSNPECREGEYRIADTCYRKIRPDAGTVCDASPCSESSAATGARGDGGSDPRDGALPADTNPFDASQLGDAAGNRSDPVASDPLGPPPAATPDSATAIHQTDAAMGPHDASAPPTDADSSAPKNNCPPNACNPGGKCISAFDDWTCECGNGYSGTGRRTCTDIDECATDQHTCRSNTLRSPCLNLPGSFTCVGRSADWPMPENGSKNKPKYSGTVEILVDEVTGLEWQNQLPTIYPGCTGTYDSNDSDNPELMPGRTCTEREADLYCGRLELGGRRGWRLPGAIELMSLVRAAELGGFSLAQSFWSAEATSAVDTNVHAAGALNIVHEAGGTHYVRCVRGVGKNADRIRYTISADGSEVTDNRTELTWERNPSKTLFTFEEARSHCTSSNRRMPTLKELATLYDFQELVEGPPTTFPFDITTFPANALLSETGYWSATDLAINADVTSGATYWIAYASGGGFCAFSYSKHPVRCVR